MERINIDMLMKLPNLPNLTMALFASLVAFSANVHSADLTNSPPKASALADAMRERRLKEINWDGILLSEIAKSLREQFRELNFMVARNVQSETISLMLREVSLEELFNALQFATD